MDIESENKDLRSKLGLLQAEYLSLVSTIAREQPREFIRLACEAVLGIESESPNIFGALLEPDERERLARFYSGLVTAMVADCERRSNVGSEGGISSGEYVSLADWITRYFSADPVHPDFTSPDTVRILHAFFGKQEQAFGYAMSNACDLIYHGLPLFERDEPSGQYVPVPFSHDDYIYLSKKGEHCDFQHRGTFPYWAKKYFFKRDHLESHKIFFGGVESGATDGPEAVAALRTAFRRHIGFDAQSTAPRPGASGHSTRMMGLMAKVLERFYGSNFDPKHRDTWSSQAQVMDWIQTTFHGTSEAEAKALDTITRPDEARRRS